jgi:hypothetical protein
LLVDRMVAGGQNGCWWAEWLMVNKMWLVNDGMVAGEQNGCW